MNESPPGRVSTDRRLAPVSSGQGVLAERERELLELKGPCSNKACRLHYAHAGPCDERRVRA